MAYTIKLDISEVQRKRVAAQLRKIGNPQVYHKAIGRSLAKTLPKLIFRTPRRTGALRKGWAAGFRVLGLLRFRIENPLPYAPPVEEGSRPHVIVPRRKKVLRFLSDGNIIFTRKVNHPGTKAVEMLKRSVEDFRRALKLAVFRTMRQVTRG